MAFISQQDKQDLMPKIKAVLNKYGIKATFSIRNGSALVAKITSGNLDLVGEKLKCMHENNAFLSYDDIEDLEQNQYFQVSHQLTRNIAYSENAKAFWQEFIDALKGDK